MSEDCPYCQFSQTDNCRGCWEGSHYKPKPITNYDRIISKTPEELARYMTEVQMYFGCPNDDAMDCRDNCAMCWLDWLRQEVEE